MKSIFIIIALIAINPLFGQSIKFDKKIGDKSSQQVKSTSGLYDDSSMNAYLNKVGQRLVSQLDSALFDFHFYIVKDVVPNAFALPGGHIFITTSLIPILVSEDELAGIIGHEIIHSNNRHTVQQVRKRVLPSLITLPIKITNAVVPLLTPITNPILASESLLFAGYSRKYETEADELGATLAAKAGYNPLALISALNRLMKTFELLTGEKEKQSYFADHPYTPIREENIKSIASTVTINKQDKITNNFNAEFDGIIYGSSPNKGILINNTLYHVGKNIYVKYPIYWRVENRDTLVAGYSPHKDAAYVIQFTDRKHTPKQMGDNFIDNFPKKYRSMIVKSGGVKINNIDCYVVNLEEPSYDDTSFVSQIWMPWDNYMLNISLMSDIKDNITILDITESIRGLTKEETKSIRVKHIEIAEAKEGETVKELCKRVGNKTSYHMVAIINDISTNDKLKKHQQVKVVIEKYYLDTL